MYKVLLYQIAGIKDFVYTYTLDTLNLYLYDKNRTLLTVKQTLYYTYVCLVYRL